MGRVPAVAAGEEEVGGGDEQDAPVESPRACGEGVHGQDCHEHVGDELWAVSVVCSECGRLVDAYDDECRRELVVGWTE